MKNPIVQKFLDGKNDAGGTIADLERENATLKARILALEAAIKQAATLLDDNWIDAAAAILEMKQ